MSIKKWWRYGKFVLIFIIILLVGTLPTKKKCLAGCGPNDSYCTSQCCYGTTVVQDVIGCSAVGSYCSPVYSSIYPVSCPSPGCKYEHDVHACSSSCQLVSDIKVTGCCKSGGPPAATNTPKPAATKTPTRTPTQTPTATPTATPTPIPLVAGLTASYGSLALMAPKLHLPAQTLDGTISGGTLPYTVSLYVQSPDGVKTQYALSPGTSFSFGATESGDPNFGTAQQGTWRAWFTVRDRLGQVITSNTAVWDVAFYPVHESP
jgi:hypothetical protein